MKEGYSPIDIKFRGRMAYYTAFDEYYTKHSLFAMEPFFAGNINARLDKYLNMFGD